MPTDMPSRIVVRGTNWVGDTIISLPAARRLRTSFPQSEITFWVPSGLAPLVKAAGVADAIICFDGNSGGPLRRPFAMKHTLKRSGFDMAVLFQNAFESAFTAWLAGIKIRVGFPTDLRGPLLNVRVPLDARLKREHQVYYYLAITDFLERQWLGINAEEKAEPDCSIALADNELQRGRERLALSGADLSRRLICLCPGSVNSEAKRWPPDCFARLGDLLSEDLGAQVVFLGAPQERSLVDSIVSGMRSGRAINLAGTSDMIGSMAVMRLSSLVISNDTGSAHLAVAASAKVLTIFGPTVPGATAPLGPNAFIIKTAAGCAPCRHFTCPKPGHPCMRNISPETLLRKVEEIL